MMIFECANTTIKGRKKEVTFSVTSFLRGPNRA